jgi:hypothetical protein
MNERIYEFTKTKWNFILSFLWGLAEATFFFIVPDVYLSFVLMFNMRSGMLAVCVSIIGSLFGAAVLYLLHTFSYDFARIFLITPGVTHKMIAFALPFFRDNLFLNLTSVPFSGIPFKLYVYSAAHNSVPFLIIIIWAIAARIVRLSLPILFFIFIRKLIKKKIRSNPQFWIFLYIVAWSLFYVWYFISIYKAF